MIAYNKLSQSFLSEVKIKPIEQRERNTIIMIASLSKAKGLFTFIDIAQQMPNLFFRLIISAKEESIADFFNCNIPANVELIPVQRNIHPFLHTSDLLLNLSIPSLCVETFGMTILEAMAYGIPAIVPNAGGPTEVVLDGYNGYCTDVTNVPKVVDAISLALEEKEYTRLSENALERLKMFV